jgi:hypothetical protein
MPSLDWRPRFSYGPIPTVWTATIPMRIWRRRYATTGGADRAATWLGASYKISDAYLLVIRIRYLESEENALFAAIDYLRAWPNTGTFWPNVKTLGTSFEVDVQEPMMGVDMEGREDDEFPEAREIEVVIRNVAGTAWPMTWF